MICSADMTDKDNNIINNNNDYNDISTDAGLFRRRRRERDEKEARRSQEYVEGGDEADRPDDTEYSDLYAIPTKHSEPVRRGMKDGVFFLC